MPQTCNGTVQIMLLLNPPQSIQCTWTQSRGMLNSLKSFTLKPQFPSSLVHISGGNPFLGCHIWSRTVKISPSPFVAAMSTVSTPQPSSSSTQDETTQKASQPLQVNFLFNWKLDISFWFDPGYLNVGFIIIVIVFLVDLFNENSWFINIIKLIFFLIFSLLYNNLLFKMQSWKEMGEIYLENYFPEGCVFKKKEFFFFNVSLI